MARTKRTARKTTNNTPPANMARHHMAFTDDTASVPSDDEPASPRHEQAIRGTLAHLTFQANAIRAEQLEQRNQLVAIHHRTVETANVVESAFTQAFRANNVDGVESSLVNSQLAMMEIVRANNQLVIALTKEVTEIRGSLTAPPARTLSTPPIVAPNPVYRNQYGLVVPGAVPYSPQRGDPHPRYDEYMNHHVQQLRQHQHDPRPPF
jgi:hypothetical protein